MPTDHESELFAKSPGRSSPSATRKKRGLVMRWLRRIALLAIAAAVVVGLVLAWLPKPMAVDLAEVTHGPLRVTVDEDGRARVKDRFVISAPLVGSLARIELDPGDAVVEGQMLARLVPLLPPLMDERTRTSAEARVAATDAGRKQVRAQLERATAAYKHAKTQAARMRALAESNSISPAALDDAVLQERATQAELSSLEFAARVSDHELQMAAAALRRVSGTTADSRAERLDVVSPVSGRVLRVVRQSEGVVQPGEPLLELGDPEALELVVDVLTTDAVRIKSGARVDVERWGGPPLEGRVRVIEPSAFTQMSSLGVEEQRVNVLIDLASPKEQWASLGDGYRVETRVVVWEEPTVVKVPSSALFRHEEGWALYRVEEEKARLTPVTVGERTPSEVQVLTELAVGTRVIVYPSDLLADGAAVRER